MFCVRTIGMMWRVLNHKNVQKVLVQCHADEYMCMICCSMRHTLEYSGYQQVSCCIHHVLQWDYWTAPRKHAIKNPPTSCHAYKIMRRMWCVRNRSSVSQLTFCLRFQSDRSKSVCIMSYVWDHAYQRTRSRTQDCTTRSPTLLYYSCCFDFVLWYCAMWYSYNPDFCWNEG